MKEDPIVFAVPWDGLSAAVGVIMKAVLGFLLATLEGVPAGNLLRPRP